MILYGYIRVIQRLNDDKSIFKTISLPKGRKCHRDREGG